MAALLVAPRGAHAGGTDSRLRAAERRYAAHLAAERPDLGSRLGIVRADARLEPVTAATLARDAVTLAAIADSLDAIGRAAPAAPARARIDTLRARIAREREPLRSGAWRTDPAIYLALAHDAPLESAARAHTSPCERARRVAARLRRVPEVLRSAEVNLGREARADSAAAARWRDAMRDLRTEIPARLGACNDAERYAALVEADTLALDAMRRFATFLDGRGAMAPAGGGAR